MVRLSKTNKVLFVEPRPYLKPALRRLASGKWHRTETGNKGLRKILENLYVYRPPAYAPISGKRILETVTSFIRVAELRRAMRSLGMYRPILWLERPDMWNEVGKYDEKLLIYRVVDEYSAYSGLSDEAKSLVQRQEEYLLHEADLVLVTSEALMQTKAVHSSHTHVLPHGVDFAAFAVAAADSWLPDDIKDIPKPIIGYSGLVSARLDIGLLAEIAIAHSNWSLVLLGEINPVICEDELAELSHIRNAHFLGPVDVRKVPHYVKAFDVGLIPYRVDEQSYNINPLKLLEYLACGKPVVSVDIPSVRSFAHVVKIAASTNAFPSLVEEALTETGPQAAQRRRAVAAHNTWDSRAELFSELVQAALLDKRYAYQTK